MAFTPFYDQAFFTKRVTVGKNSTTTMNNTDVTIPWDTETLDTDVMHDTVTNNSRITVVTPGVYVFGCNGFFSANVLAQVKIRKNATTDVAITRAANSTTEAVPCVTEPLQLSAGDYMEVIATAASGVFNTPSRFWAYRIA